MIDFLFHIATVLQGVAVLYAVYLARRRQALAAWVWLIGGMLSMFTWRLVNLLQIQTAESFNPTIAMWGSICLFASMFYFGREVRRREKAEKERDALLDSERAARTEAERASRLKDEFLSMVSHELRTPLTAILGWCHLLKPSSTVSGGALNRSLDPTELEEGVSTIERNARIQSRLIEDLLDVTRIDAGKLTLNPSRVQLAEAVSVAVDTIRPAAEAKSIRLTPSLDDQVYVSGDPVRLQQIALNLLSNAVKFTPEDGTIEVRVARVDATDHAELVIRDSGEGISPDFLPHLFSRFRQSDAGTARRHAGLGLGLSIVKRLVELHGGRVAAFSEGVGKGATMTVRIPLAHSHQDPDRNARDLAGHEPLKLLNGAHLLVLDDEADVRTVLKRILERAGATVTAVDRSESAFAALQVEKFDAFVSDIGLPGEDGLSLIRRIRADSSELNSGVPAIALTAYARATDRELALEAGFQQHLSKPIQPSELVGAIRALIGPSHSTGGRQDASRPVRDVDDAVV